MTNQYTKAKELGIEYTIKEETRRKIGEANKKRVWTEESRKKRSEAMKKAVTNNPDSYTSSNRGRTKQIIFDGIKFQGRWELQYYLYCKHNKIEIQRCNEWFEYEWDGTRKYFPDFFLPKENTYVEIKGYQTDRDLAKWSQFKKPLKIIKKPEIDIIVKYNQENIEEYKSYFGDDLYKKKTPVPSLPKGMKLRKKTDAKWEPLKEKVLNSNINFGKYGWVNEVSRILNLSPQKVSIWMKRHLPEFYEKCCFKRKINF